MGHFQTLSRKLKKNEHNRIHTSWFQTLKSEKFFKILSKKFSKLRHTIRFYNPENIRFLEKEFENHHLAFHVLKIFENFKTSHF